MTSYSNMLCMYVCVYVCTISRRSFCLIFLIVRRKIMYSDILSIVCTVHILIFGRQNTLTLLILPPFDHAPSLYPASSPSCVLLETDDPPGITWGGGTATREWWWWRWCQSVWAAGAWLDPLRAHGVPTLSVGELLLVLLLKFWKYFWASVRI